MTATEQAICAAVPKTAQICAALSRHQAHQLFADACNCAAMARWYTQRGNIAAATRKARQHLAALRQLAKLEGVHHA